MRRRRRRNAAGILESGSGRQCRSLNVEKLEHRMVLTISGFQFIDADLDGEFDSGESPLPGVVVYIDANDNGRRDGGEPFDVSDASGAYQINNVPTGSNWVQRVWPLGYEPTTAPFEYNVLVGLTGVADAASPTGEYLQYRFLDTQTGNQTATRNTEVPVSNVSSASTDGEFIYIVDNAQDVFLQIRFRGGLVHSVPLPRSEDGTTPYTPGPMVLGDQVYVYNNDGRLYDWDPLAGTFTRSRTVQIASDIAASLPDGLPTISAAIAETIDGETIDLFAFADDRVFEFDPKTATVTGVTNNSFTTGSDWNAATLGDEFFFRGQGTNQQLIAFDSDFNSLRMLGEPAVSSLVGGPFLEYGEFGSTTSDLTLNHGYRRITGTISGVVSNDLDGDGAIDSAEQGVTGVTVFLDLNENDWPDAGEPSTVTASDGSYTIADVLPGEYVVKAVPPRFFRHSDAYPREDRLFAVNHASPGASLRLYELDPTDGSLLETQLLDIPKSIEVGLEYDGQRLLLVHDEEQMIYELATDGSIIDSRRLGEPLTGGPSGGFSNKTDYGPVTIGGVTYHVRESLGALELVRYIPESDAFVRWLPVTWDWGLESLPATPPSIPSYGRIAAGASADGTKIVLASEDGREILIDPRTGIATFETAAVTDSRRDTALAGFGGRHYKAFLGAPVEVYDESGTLVDTWPHFSTLAGLGGAASPVTGVRVALDETQAISEVNHHLQSTLSTLTGSVFEDTNANGSLDATESALANVDVYVDINRNRLFDLGEPVVQTDASGVYRFDGVPDGQYVIRQMPVASKLARATTDDAVRLFGIREVNSSIEIRELDPLTGWSLRLIPAPDWLTRAAGLAVTGSDLYVADGNRLARIDAETGDLEYSMTIGTASISGIAIVGDTAYLQDYMTDEILVFDLLRRHVVRRMDLGLINNGVAGSINLSSSLGEAADGQNLAVRQSSSSILIVDPLSGLIVDEQDFSFVAGLAGAGDELFVAWTANVRAYDKLGLFRRYLVGADYYGLGAESSAATEHHVAVYLEESITDLSFANVSDTGTVSGVQFEDFNEDGVRDAEEPGLEGVTIFADLNGNDWPDSDEPQTQSASDGSYSLNVPLGRQLIRTLPPRGFASTKVVEAVDRLFAFTLWQDTSNPPNDFIQLLEVDPIGGQVLSRIDTDIPFEGLASMAYDGRRLIVTDRYRGTISVIGTDGSLIGETALPGNNTFVPGPVVIDGTVYVLTLGGGLPSQLIRFDPDSLQFYGAMPLSRLVDQDPIYAGDLLPTLSSVSESADGRSILATSTRDARVFEIDPLTARVVDVTEVERANNAAMATGLNGEWLIRGQNTSLLLDAYDGQFNLLRSTPFVPSFGLAGGPFADSGTVVSVLPVTLSGLDGGQRETTTTVSGIVSRDDNGNGLTDGDEGIGGLTVYIDANRNAVFDVDEVSTITQGDGSYHLNGLLPGDYIIRVVTDDGPVTTLEDTTFVYALEVNGSEATIRRHDAITNEVLREFPAPGTVSSDAGLAVGTKGVYYASGNELWVLGSDDGEVKGSLVLPAGTYTGVAAVGDHVYALDSDSDVIVTVDPATLQVVGTLDINSVNASDFDLLGSLGESADGSRLFARANEDNLVIHPDTGVIEQQVAFTSSAGLAGAAGENFHSFGDSLRVASLEGVVVRQTSLGYFAWAIGAAEMTNSEYAVRAAKDVDFANRDFLIRPLPTISGTVFNDNDYDQIRGTGEAGVAGVTVFIDTNLNGLLDANEPFRVTAADDPGTTDVDESGHYEFDNTEVGTYSIRQVVLADSVATTPSVLQVELTPAGSVGNDFGQTELTLIDVDYGDPESRSIINRIVVQFSETVDVDPGAFRIENQSDTNLTVETSFVLDNSGSGTIATLMLAGDSVDAFGSLVDGNYELTILSTHVRDSEGIAIDGDGDGVLGGNRVDRYFRLFGDTDGDRDVDGQDFGRFGATFLKTDQDSEFNSQLDSDGDGDVDGQDFGRFGERFLTTLPD
ncbi:MAG: SdrD B-like domain-containing protein [Planctomycetota bacterium]